MMSREELAMAITALVAWGLTTAAVVLD